MITTAERASKLSGESSRRMKSDDLIASLIEGAQHRVINEECTKTAETALAAHTKKGGRSKGKQAGNTMKYESDVTCSNCKRTGHTGDDCWSKGGGKEGQGPKQKKSTKIESAVIAVNNDDDTLFAFACRSDHVDIAEALQLPKSQLGTCIDSAATHNFSPDHSQFTNYRPIERKITTADGRSLKAISMRDLHIDLPNGSKKTRTVFKNAIHAPQMAFTLISIGRLDKAGCQIVFYGGMCTIINANRRTIATMPHSDGLYKISASKQSNQKDSANVVSGKMSISEAHRKIGHIAHSAIKHAVLNNYVTGIELDSNSKPEFCKACTQAKSARQPFCHGLCSVTFFPKNNQRTAPMESPMMATSPLFSATIFTGHPRRTYIGALSEYFLYSDTTNKTCILIIVITNQHHVLSTAAQPEPHHAPHTLHVPGQSHCACTSS